MGLVLPSPRAVIREKKAIGFTFLSRARIKRGKSLRHLRADRFLISPLPHTRVSFVRPDLVIFARQCFMRIKERLDLLSQYSTRARGVCFEMQMRGEEKIDPLIYTGAKLREKSDQSLRNSI